MACRVALVDSGDTEKGTGLMDYTVVSGKAMMDKTFAEYLAAAQKEQGPPYKRRMSWEMMQSFVNQKKTDDEEVKEAEKKCIPEETVDMPEQYWESIRIAERGCGDLECPLSGYGSYCPQDTIKDYRKSV